MKRALKNKKLLAGIGVVLVLILGGWWWFGRGGEVETPRAERPKQPVNVIPIEERPYVTLQPLVGRNLLEVTIHTLPKEAETVELILEYDRNKGVMDAVLYTYLLTSIPYTDEAFLGSKSAGGHTTYHDDVIGGMIVMNFEDSDYALEFPWRYIDSEDSYEQLSTTDGRFQLVLEKPILKSKVIVMETSGLPSEVEGEFIAGPYFVSTVGDLPDTTASIQIRILEDSDSVTILGWDGEEWVEYETSVDGKTVTAEGPLLSTFVVVK